MPGAKVVRIPGVAAAAASDDGPFVFSGVTGTNTITGTSNGPALAAAQTFILVPANTNSGAVTLNGVAVKKADGSALAAGDLVANKTHFLEYDGTVFRLLTGGLLSAADITAAGGALDADLDALASSTTSALAGKLGNSDIATSANALVSTTNTLAIYVTSSDGSDSGRASLNGGGADGQSSRGARLVCFGNEHASSAGDVNIVLGAVAGAALTVTDNTAVARLVVSETGVQVVGTVTVTNGAVNVAGTSTPTMGLGRDGLGNLAIVSTWALTVTTPGGVTFGNAVDVATAAVAVPSTTFTTVRAVAISPCRISATVVGMGCAEFYWDGATLSVWKGLADTNIVAASSAASGEVAWRMSGGNLQASNNTGSSKNCYAGLVKR